MEYKDPGRYIPIIYLLYSWGSLFGVPSRVPLGLGLSMVMGTVRFRIEGHSMVGLPMVGLRV